MLILLTFAFIVVYETYKIAPSPMVNHEKPILNQNYDIFDMIFQNWEYRHEPTPDSAEEKLMKVLKQPRDWV